MSSFLFFSYSRASHVPVVSSSHWRNDIRNGGMFRKRLWNWIWAYWVCSYNSTVWPRLGDAASYYYILSKRARAWRRAGADTRTGRFVSVTSYFSFQVFLLYLWYSTSFFDKRNFRYVAIKLAQRLMFDVPMSVSEGIVYANFSLCLLVMHVYNNIRCVDRLSRSVHLFFPPVFCYYCIFSLNSIYSALF